MSTTSGPVQCSFGGRSFRSLFIIILGGLHEKECRGLEVKRQRAGNRCKAFERRTDGIGDACGHVSVHWHACDVSHGLDLLGSGSCHAASFPFAGARLWPEPGMAM